MDVQLCEQLTLQTFSNNQSINLADVQQRSTCGRLATINPADGQQQSNSAQQLN